MSGIENYRVRQAHDPLASYDGQPEEDDAPDHPLNSPQAEARHRQLLEWYESERERQAVNRYQMALDEDFYDHLQWSEEDAAELRERGQAPLVFNLVKPTVDWILGTEKRTRIDGRVFPREEDDSDGADVKTKLLKYLSDVNKTPFSRSHSFADAVKAGLGWIEDCINRNPGEELLQTRYESWRYILHDSHGLERDLSDSRYLFRWKWVDLDVAIAHFPDRESELRQAAVAAELFGNEQDEEFWYLGEHFQARDTSGNVLGRRTFISDTFNVNNRRSRVKLIEGWYRTPQSHTVCCGDVFDGQPYDKANKAMTQAHRQGAIRLHTSVAMRMRCAIFTEGHLLIDTDTPYRHNRFPFTPIWAYRRARDNAPYGAIRGMRDPQEDLNKRASKALFILSTNQVITEKNAVDDWDELADEVSRPDGIIVLNAGFSTKFEIRQDKQLAEEHLMLMDRDRNMIQYGSGVTDENLGRETNAKSGKAIIARQQQGSVVTAELFDNLRYALQLEGEIQLSLTEQFYTQPKVARLVGAKGKVDWLKVNQVDPATGEILNDITARQADYVIGEQDWNETLRISMFEALGEIIGRMPPEIAVKFLDVWISLADGLPEKDELVKRIRQISGVEVPEDEMTEEELAAAEKRRAAQSEQEAIAREQVMKALEELDAKIGKLRAERVRILAEAKSKVIDTNAQAIETAATVMGAPAVAPAGDALLQAAESNVTGA